jgi:Tfp pilus assembly protein PilX
MKGIDVRSDERGFALVISILVLLVMSALALVLMIGVAMNRGLAGNDQRMRQALNTSEAGLSEAMARISHQDINDVNMDPADPDDVVQIFNTVAGSVPVLGADSSAMATAQTVGSYLNYSTAGRSGDELTVSWKKSADGTKVMRYDASTVPHINTVSGLPIYTITSTGRIGNARRTVVAEVIQKPFTATAKAALSSNVMIKEVGTAFICGFDHSMDTADDDGIKGRTVGVSPDPEHCGDNELARGTDLPGAWSTANITSGGASGIKGSPSDFEQNQTGFYAGPWEAFGMSSTDYWSWIGAPTTSPASYNGIVYYDGNTTTMDKSTDLALHNVSGEGLLYVDGDLTVNAGFTYRGLIYVEGDFNCNGHAWILGGVIVNGVTDIKANGNMTILYSADAITQALSKYGGRFVTLSWREK